MNYKVIFRTLGSIFKVEALLMLLPLVASLIFMDGAWFGYVIPIVSLLVIGFLLTLLIKQDDRPMYAREGFVITGFSWILLSLFGCLPFIITGAIPSFIDAFFETVSGFTTTGATILNEVESLPKSILLWRSFTHWIGGMGVLVFTLAILPKSNGQNIYILKAESTGPNVGKLVSKIRSTARILYLIYIAITVLEFIFLVCGDMPLFDSIVNSFSTAGTGGFAIKNAGIGEYSIYSQVVIAIFMLIFGINFNIFFLMILGKMKQVFKSEELWIYIGIILISTGLICFNVYSLYNSFGLALKDSFFQVCSIITTTGFATTDFINWPLFSKGILFILMFIGGCAGSTAGGLKVSRITILAKSIKRDLNKLLHRNSVSNIHFEHQSLDEDVVKNVTNYFSLFMFLTLIFFVLVSLDGKDFTTTFTAIIACINNVGPGLSNLIGPYGSFSSFSGFSKLILIFAMLIGRLEIYPVVMLFNPRLWTNK